MRKITRRQKIIASALNVSTAGIACLTQAAAHRDGLAQGGVEVCALAGLGHLVEATHLGYGFVITASGRELVERARSMGW